MYTRDAIDAVKVVIVATLLFGMGVVAMYGMAVLLTA